MHWSLKHEARGHRMLYPLLKEQSHHALKCKSRATTMSISWLLFFLCRERHFRGTMGGNMDFLDPKKMRWHTIRLLVGYVLVAFAILLATTLLILYAYGFRLNRDGELNQKGLVFFSSLPSGAELYIDGNRKDTTNVKLNLVSGTYHFVIRREGYTDWQRTVRVDGGSVEHYVYPMLFPQEITPTELTMYDTVPVLSTQSPDKRWLVIQSTRGDSFLVYDLNRGQADIAQATAIDVPATLLTESATPATWEVLEWSTNNRHFLAKRTFTVNDKKQFEYVLVDRQRPEGSHNLSEELGVTPDKLTLRDKKPDQYYVYDGTKNTLSRASLGSPTPQVFLQNVLGYASHGDDMVLYATNEGADESRAVVRLREQSRTYDIRTIDESDVYLLDLARYDGKWYMIIGSQAEDRVYLYEDPVAQLRRNSSGSAIIGFAFTIDNPTRVSFSANAQFIMVQNGAQAHVYDVDDNQAWRYKFPYPVEGPETYATWMDGHRLSYVSGGRQVVVEYDNANRRELSESDKRHGGFYDRNSEYLYTFTPREDGEPGLALSATPLRTPADL